MAKCKKCGGSGWRTLDLKSDKLSSILIMAGVDCEVACDCQSGKVHLEQAKTEAKRNEH